MMKPARSASAAAAFADVLVVLEPDFLQREMLIEELARGVVVLDGKACAGNPVILGRQFDE